jgi:hypothetical protein
MSVNQRMLTLASTIVVLGLSTTSSFSQQSSSSPLSTVLQGSQAALGLNAVQLNDITLTGTAEYILGSTDETGTIKLRAMNDGSSRMDVSISSGTVTDSTYHSDSQLVGEARDEHGKLRKRAHHNLMTETAWFCPAMLIQHFAFFSRQAWVSTPASENNATFNSSTLILRKQASTGNDTADAEIKRLSQFRMTVDTASFLPQTVKYETHSDTNATVNIPVEVRFSAYAVFSGVMVPTHIKKYINGVLQLDISVSDVAINTGLTNSDFLLQ